MMTYEQTVATLHNAYAYKIPPTLNIDNFTCENWPQDWMIFQGSMKVVTTEDKCFVVLLNTDSSEATRFPVQFKGALPVINQASDSSRYFVLVVLDPSGTRQAFVGIGFRDRETAFDFKVSLSDFGKWLERKKNPISVQPVQVDFSLKQGEKIKINVPKAGQKEASKPVSKFAPPPDVM